MTEVRPARVASIDIFRGLTMAVMIFVNDLDGVHGLPWWTHHAKAEINAMTYVDMVFPFFLFLIGLSMPLAIAARLKKNPSLPALWLHVLVRSISLIVLGIILANADLVDDTRTHMQLETWTLFGLLGMALFLAVYPAGTPLAPLYRGLRILGVALTLFMLAIFRRLTSAGYVAWLDFSYLEILGLIGVTYFAVALLYIPTRRWPWAPLAWFAALIGFSAICAAKWIVFERTASLLIFPFGDGTMAMVVMAGIVTSTLFRGDKPWLSLRNKMVAGVSFGVACLILGRILTPLGISKIRDTPTWGLYSIAAAVLLFTGLYWWCDIKRHIAWTAFVRPAGANTLLTYLLPDVWFFLSTLFGFAWIEGHFSAGWPGVARAFVFTAAMLALSSLCYRLRIRLQL